jgi:SIR2-like domain
MSDEMVFVLGAGFTRAFVPAAPLLVDDYEIPRLRERFASFSHAARILDDALAARSDGRVDLERLLTRLSGMPYDSGDARRELALLETDLRKELVRRLKDAQAAGVDWDKLKAFARLVLTKGASIVTFNYDDVLDQALWEARKEPTGMHSTLLTESDWHPDGGYGFYCRDSSVCIADHPGYMDQPRTLLLKLHGSLNWRSRLGEGAPRGPAGLLHHEDWYTPRLKFPAQHAADRIEAHLERDPFIVPPVLVKSELTVHPVLSVVWKLAHERLTAATTVAFIGYSLPVTDLASRILFSEALLNRAVPNVEIANLAQNSAAEQCVKEAYRSLIPDLPDAHFHFAGAQDWIDRQAD